MELKIVSGLGIMQFMTNLKQTFKEGWEIAGSPMYTANAINIQVSKNK